MSTERHVPNLVIFRVPDEDGEKVFAEVKIEDGVLSDELVLFGLPEDAVDDSYHQMEFNHIIIASETEDREGSIDLAQYEITGEDNVSSVNVYESEDIRTMIETVYDDYVEKNGKGGLLQ